MTTLDVVPRKADLSEETAAKELVRQAREQGLSLSGPDGLLEQFTKSVLEPGGDIRAADRRSCGNAG